MVGDKRYLIGHYLSYRGIFILEGDTRASDPEAAMLAWLASTGRHREYEAAHAPPDDDFAMVEYALHDRGFPFVRTAHEVPDDLDAPAPNPRTDEQLDAGDACLKAHPYVLVGARETEASIRANRVLISEESLEELVRNAYALSFPQGLGFLHARKGGLDDDTVKEILNADEGPFLRLHMDYVHGRSIKLAVHRDKNKDVLFIAADRARPWYDHTRSDFAELMKLSLTDADKERNADYLADLVAEVEA